VVGTGRIIRVGVGGGSEVIDVDGRCRAGGERPSTQSDGDLPGWWTTLAPMSLEVVRGLKIHGDNEPW
jgi:hypothetical protein